MKSVLISIKPKWCELIVSGKKTVEVRKTKPKLETPFKCYIYCTKNGKFMVQSKTNPAKKTNQIKITMRYYLIPVRMAVTKKNRNNECCRGCGEK